PSFLHLIRPQAGSGHYSRFRRPQKSPFFIVDLQVFSHFFASKETLNAPDALDFHRLVRNMFQKDFITHPAPKGVLLAPGDGGVNLRPRDGLGDLDWVGLTKLTPSGFADELAAFYRCDRVRRNDLVGGRFAGAKLSPRFLREERLFPYEHPSGTLTLAIARPVEDETIRAA